jgi:hypothetical protein
MVLQLEDVTALDTGRLANLVGAFPDEEQSFDFSAYSSGGICLFLGVLPPARTLPAQPLVAGILQEMGEQVLAGRTVFPMALAPWERIAVRSLAEVFVEVVIDGRYKGFQLIAAPREVGGEVEICVSQEFCDLVLGRWDRWTSGGGDSAETPLQPWSWVGEEPAAAEVEAPSLPGPRRGNRESASGGFRPHLRRLTGFLSPGRAPRRDPFPATA